MKCFKFLSYLILHKWYVFIQCCRYGIPWRGIFHDISKFLPWKFIPYADHYNAHLNVSGERNRSTGLEHSNYDLAWLIHQKKIPHHWQWWILYGEESGPRTIPMADCYIKEMVVDWYGAGRAQGEPDTIAW